MVQEDNVIPRGPFKGKKIKFAPAKGVDMFWEISKDFMKKVFDFKAGEYLITDESILSDFTGLDDMEISDIQAKIQQVYEVDVSDIQSGKLVDIFTRIHSRKYGEPTV